MKSQPHSIPVVDVDSAFPAMVERPGGGRDTAVAGDVGPQVSTVLRDILGWRPRAGDPLAFTHALGAAFRLRQVQGHVEADFVPRGYAVQADLGAVTGGQASLYRRAMLARTEALRILDGLTTLRVDADPQDVESYRALVRNAVERLVDELGAAGGPRVQMVDLYFVGLTGDRAPVNGVTADTVAGQLGALRDRFGLVNGNVNTVEEEGVRTAFWTLVDLVTDLQRSWAAQRTHFGGAAGQGFLGTDLILLSRLMEAAADQVDEVEGVLDSVLIEQAERRTLVLDTTTGLTLDGLLTWLHAFLSDEGRRLAQDGGRDGIVSALAPMAVELVKVFRGRLADLLEGLDPDVDEDDVPVRYLPTSCCAELPAGMYAARTRIAVAALCRLLMDLARTAQRIGRWAEPVVISVTFRRVQAREGVFEVEFRGINFRSAHIPAFVAERVERDRCHLEELGTDGLVLALRGSSTADEESITALFHESELVRVPHLEEVFDTIEEAGSPGGFAVPAEVLPLAIVDGENGSVVVAPEPVTWPALRKAWHPVGVTAKDNRADRWRRVPDDEHVRTTVPGVVPIVGGSETGSEADPLLSRPKEFWSAYFADPANFNAAKELWKDVVVLQHPRNTSSK